MRLHIVPLLMIGCVDSETQLRQSDQELHAPRTIRVETGAPPTLIAYRAEAGSTWRIPTAHAPNRFSFQVAGPYRVTVICDEPQNTSVFVYQVARTTDDDRDVAVRCDTVPGRYRVTGSIVQPGEAHLHTSADASSQPNWAFELAADRGRHALVAMTGDRIAVRRLTVHGDTAVATPIDVATEGGAFVPVTLTPTNLDGTELVFTGIVTLQAAETFSLLYVGDLGGTRVAPSAVLSAHDDQHVTVTVHSATVGRTVSRAFRAGDPTTFPLPVALGPLEFDDFAVTWSTLPDYDVFELTFDAFSFETFTILAHSLELSRRFITATGATGAAVETAGLPGFRPEWQLDPAQEYHRFAGVAHELRNGDVVGSDVSEFVSP
jgi:hypothetical protein